MLKHCMTIYWVGKTRYAESRIQIKIFGKAICLSKKRIQIN